MAQLSWLEPTVDVKPRKNKLGQSSIEYKNSSSILTKASGFMESYDYTLNPYSGCSFGCAYCYAAFFARGKGKQQTWGQWVQVKENALELLKKKRKRPLINKVIYMSSVTDPYQPIERELELVRSLLKEFAEFHQVMLYVQTRSPMVTRDIDLFKQIGNVQVNMTVTTDSEKVRRAFEPYCPSNKRRLEAIKEVHAAGIDTCITMTPLLPVENSDQFAQDLLATGIEQFIIQPFHAKRGRFVAGTRDSALQLIEEMGWDDAKYAETLSIIKSYIPDIGEGKDGFKARSRRKSDAINGVG